MVTLELGSDIRVQDPKPEDIAHALAQPRDEDWSLMVTRNEENDYIDAMIDGGALRLESEVGDEYLVAQSHVDEETFRSMLVDFAAGGNAWRDMALWMAPKPKPKSSSPIPMTPQVIFGAAWAVLLVGAMLFGRHALVITVFALAFPGIIAMAAVVKWKDVQRAASWTKTSGRILRSELVKKTQNNQEVEVPFVEYEFAVGMDFAKQRGNRITLAEVEGPHGAKETLAKYRVGTSPTVYYNPDNPREAVLERDFPPNLFVTIGVVVAVLVVLILGAGYWFGFRDR